MKRCRREILLGIAAIAASTTAHADTGGSAGELLLAIAFAFYLVLNAFSLPICLLLRGSMLKRIAFGLATPVVGMALGLLMSQGLYRVRYIDFYEIDRVFVVVSAIPIVALLMWGVIGRVRSK
jgi:hypothetical protein